MARGHLLSSDEKAHHEVWRAVRRCENITRQAMEKVPRITDRHKEARLGFAKMNLGRDWAKGTEKLTRAVIEAWRAIDEENLRNPVSNMPRRLFDVALKQGGAIDY
uniref:DDE_Tnp_ISL3 domain-containing protein n=1 Tax=Haemonchus contortus TaxID=6289 RepID=A0A7I5EAJ5_HAECO